MLQILQYNIFWDLAALIVSLVLHWITNLEAEKQSNSSGDSLIRLLIKFKVLSLFSLFFFSVFFGMGRGLSLNPDEHMMEYQIEKYYREFLIEIPQIILYWVSNFLRQQMIYASTVLLSFYMLSQTEYQFKIRIANFCN